MASAPKPLGESVVVGYPQANAAAPPPSAAAYRYITTPHFCANPYYAAPPYTAAASFNHSLLRRILVAVVAAFILVGFISFLLWLILRPLLPVLSVSSATISSFNLSSPSAPAPHLSSSFNLTLSVYNPNRKMGVSYDQVSAAVSYGGYVLAETMLAPFYQEKGASNTLRATLAVGQEYVGGDLAREMFGDRESGGAVGFEVRVKAWVWFKTRALRTRGRVMRVYCDDIRIAFTNKTATAGSLAGPSKQCQVNI